MRRVRFQVLPGFRDFFPEELSLRRWIEAAWHASSRAAGFQEIDGPVLESLELFTAKSGPEIANQLYAFRDKGDDYVTRVFDLSGRPLKGWILVGPDALRDDTSLAEWVRLAADHAASLPAK